FTFAADGQASAIVVHGARGQGFGERRDRLQVEQGAVRQVVPDFLRRLRIGSSEQATRLLAEYSCSRSRRRGLHVHRRSPFSARAMAAKLARRIGPPMATEIRPIARRSRQNWSTRG